MKPPRATGLALILAAISQARPVPYSQHAALDERGGEEPGTPRNG